MNGSVRSTGSLPLWRMRTSRALAGALLGVIWSLFAPHPAGAQDVGDGFLFKQPEGSVVFRTGFARAGAGSDIFRFATEQLTLDRSDFNSLSFGLDVVRRLTDRLDLMIGFAATSSTHRSEFRDWVDDNDLPIEQETSFTRVPFTASLRYSLTPAGTPVGSYAWIPSRMTPYIGVGAGFLYYSFTQTGDFVDFQDLEIFSEHFGSRGWTPAAHLLGGFDVSVSPRVGLNFEGRYSMARAEMGEDFSGFDRIDLSGFAATVGLQIRY